jgi:hypothetical protein
METRARGNEAQFCGQQCLKSSATLDQPLIVGAAAFPHDHCKRAGERAASRACRAILIQPRLSGDSDPATDGRGLRPRRG